MNRLRSLGALAAFATLVWPSAVAADGLYLKLAADNAQTQADRPVTVRLTTLATRPFTLPTAPQFLIDDGSGMKARPEIEVRAVDAPEAGISVGPDAPFKGSWEVVLPRPGRYRIQVRYRLSDRVVQSNKVSVDVVDAKPVAAQ